MVPRFNKAAQLKLLSTKKTEGKAAILRIKENQKPLGWCTVVIPQSTRSLNCIYASLGFMSENQADRTSFRFENSS